MNSQLKKIIVRYPPSPTGKLHVGNIRTFLFNYLFAKNQGGEIVMRFEDTDKERSKKEYEEEILWVLNELGLDFDHGPFRQSERTERYIEAIEKLIRNGNAYEAEESKDGSGDKVIRFKNPNKKITYNGIVRGEITIDTTDFGDFVIARSKTNPLYHLTVVVDDIDMNITHIIRGEDHITSTPRQILLIEALGGQIPIYAHMAFTIGKDKKKLSKRHGAVSYEEFEKLGYIPDAIINYLALLGWNPGNGSEKEFFTREELIKEFSLERLNNSPAMFDYNKLDDINRQHILLMNKDDYKKKVFEFLSNKTKEKVTSQDYDFDKVIDLVIRERIQKFSDVTKMEEEGEFDYYFNAPEIDIEKIIWKDDGLEIAKKHLDKVIELLKDVNGRENWTAKKIKEKIWDYASEQGRGSVLWPMRYALSGKNKSPDPFTLAEILGKEKTLKRLNSIKI